MSDINPMPDQQAGETPATYHHAYHQSLVYKIFLANKPDEVFITLDQALDVVRRVQAVTGGLKQIVYLVGWQFDGHDSKYPAWSEVNPRLRRPGDATARDSLVWFLRAAREYNAVVSVHVNMNDAYENSPLWEEYVRQDVLIREPDGSLRKGGVWGGEQCYLVNKKREWECGLAKRRIDALLALLPLEEAHTLHIDAFEPRPDPYHGTTDEQEAEAMAGVLLYWRSRGMDVTVEWLHPRFLGLTPMVWHLNTEEQARLKYPSSLICGGGSAWNFRRRKWTLDLYGGNWIRQPEAGCLFERAWGENMTYEFQKPGIDAAFIDGFCLKTLPWYYLNRRQIVRHVHTAESYEVQYSGGVSSEVRGEDTAYRLCEGDKVLVEDTDVCLPALWRDRTLLAYSRDGDRRWWALPSDWPAVRQLNRQPWTAGAPASVVPVSGGGFELDLAPGEAVWLMAGRLDRA
jgi:hypothetical protein